MGEWPCCWRAGGRGTAAGTWAPEATEATLCWGSRVLCQAQATHLRSSLPSTSSCAFSVGPGTRRTYCPPTGRHVRLLPPPPGFSLRVGTPEGVERGWNLRASATANSAPLANCRHIFHFVGHPHGSPGFGLLTTRAALGRRCQRVVCHLTGPALVPNLARADVTAVVLGFLVKQRVGVSVAGDPASSFR